MPETLTLVPYLTFAADSFADSLTGLGCAVRVTGADVAPCTDGVATTMAVIVSPAAGCLRVALYPPAALVVRSMSPSAGSCSRSGWPA